MAECSTECRECLDDPNSECATDYPSVWMKIYEPALQKCEEQKHRECEGLKRLMKQLVQKATLDKRKFSFHRADVSTPP